MKEKKNVKYLKKLTNAHTDYHCKAYFRKDNNLKQCFLKIYFNQEKQKYF